MPLTIKQAAAILASVYILRQYVNESDAIDTIARSNAAYGITRDDLQAAYKLLIDQLAFADMR